ncbi:helix-turn-helix transcriptional regulator [Streptomyces sp. NA04227]|uniref:helix-turn-helix transcriptional regulator n=1 Tax=Streptomyces sp. NA04227 TaxID=2742136 RepID=UPI001591386A|nr:helix-turn-helix transcriptional regulator [Streptomyces sp. NA04227]QKW07613.1 helix-turn-helix transcriptional regulator [Streptomyces sp. NA04227]
MATVSDFFWERRLRRTLAGEESQRLLVLVEGAEGSGKSRLVRRLARLQEATRVPRVLWQCGRGDASEMPEVPSDGPLLLLVEDVHRAGADELAYLRGLLEHPAPGLAAAVTYRPESLAEPGSPLGSPRPRYPAELVVLRHRVEPWSREQVRQAAVAALGERCADEAVARLHERSGGSAQVVADLLAVLRDSAPKRCTADAVDAVGAPVRLAGMMRDRLAAVPARHRVVVWAAAVLDEPATRRELLTVAGLGPEHGRAALVAATARSALVTDAEGRYVLPVPLGSVAVREGLPWPVLQDLHGRAADVLLGRQPVPWAVVARHRGVAGHVRGWLRAVEQAARESAEEERHQEAVTLLERTLTSPLVPRSARARLSPMLARSATVGLHVEQSVELLSQIVEDETLPESVRGEVRLNLGLVLTNQVGGGQLGWPELEQAAEELREHRPDLAARAMIALAATSWPGQSLDVHLAWMARAEEAANASEDEAIRVNTALTRAWVECSYGNPRGWDLLRSLPADSPDPELRREVARCLCNIADSAVWLGWYDRAEKLLADGVALASGSPYTEYGARGTRLVLDWSTGHWTGLAERCESYLAEGDSAEGLSGDGHYVLGLLGLAHGEWSRTTSWLSGVADSSNDLAAGASAALVRLSLAREDTSAAVSEARAAWQRVAEKAMWVGTSDLPPRAVEAVALADGAAAAQQMVDAFAAGIDGREAPAAQAALIWARAVLAEVTGAPTEAVPLYRAAAEAYAALHHPYAEALTGEGAARCVLGAEAGAGVGSSGDGSSGVGSSGDGSSGVGSSGDGSSGVGSSDDGRAGATATAGTSDEDRARAIDELSAAVERFTYLGANWDAARARALLRAHRPEKRPRGRPSYHGDLSPREREVAELAATGLTNREIASTLHLSHRTVEQHIAHAMRKVGTDSRRGLVPRAGAEGSGG